MTELADLYQRRMWARPIATLPMLHQQHTVVHERDVAYRLSLFEHPFASTLQRRLLRGSTKGLLDADTEYLPGNTRLTGSVVVEVPKTQGSAPATTNTVFGLFAHNQPHLLANTVATKPGPPPVQVNLGAGLRITFGQGSALTPTSRVIVRLDHSLSPDSDTYLTTRDEVGQVVGDAIVETAQDLEITLLDGNPATVPAGTKLILPDRLRVIIPSNTTVKVQSSQRTPALYNEFIGDYSPGDAVRRPLPVEDLDFSLSGPYAGYNWELFYHVPLTVAIHLSRNGRFAEAQHWLHYIFDPTDSSDEPTPERFWKVRPFQTTKARSIEEILVNLATGADRDLRDDTVAAIEAWRANPFRPHLVARFRPDAYMYRAVTAYLDNLIAWGDSLFQQDTGEAVDEALSHYMLASAILGPKPQQTPTKGAPKRQTYADLRAELGAFGSVLRQIETDLPFDLMPTPPELSPEDDRAVAIRGIGTTLYFCVPRSDKLLSYWRTVEDRLYKIHNSLNLQGVFRRLALFEPPIDPALLARATAAGLDVSAVVSGLNQPLPLVRFQLLLQKALELAQEVKSLGSGLLSAMEKEDAETLAILRSRHERATLSISEQLAYGRLQEAIKARESVAISLNTAVERYVLAERQLGRKDDEIRGALRKMDDLDMESLSKLKLRADEPSVAARSVSVDIAADLAPAGGKVISSYEAKELEIGGLARSTQDVAKGLGVLGQILEFIPDVGIDFHWWGLGGHMDVFGGRKLGQVTRLQAEVLNWGADWMNWAAGQTAKMGSFARRQSELEERSAFAAHELTRAYKDLRAAQLREAIAGLELSNVRSQVRQAAEVQYFLTSEKGEHWPQGATAKQKKTTNQAMYAWMKRETRALYTDCYKLAFDVARKAERALQHELGNPQATYLQPTYAAGREGLLTGERLYLDLKRMELAYLETNRREYELTKRVSLSQIDPEALITLRTTGECSFDIPEALYDLGGAGQYFRRIKSVAVSIPCVASDYTGVNCTLTLTGSSIRTSPLLTAEDDPYARTGDQDDRFSDYTGSSDSIATSAATTDSGMFEPNLRDERYLPFEYAGAVSSWRLTLPGDPSKGDPLQYDYNTITDVVLHVRYTAREGGERLRRTCLDSLKRALSSAGVTRRLLSLRYDFPAVWAKLQVEASDSNTELTAAFEIEAHHFPYYAQSSLPNFSDEDDGSLTFRLWKISTRADGRVVSTDNPAPTRLPGGAFAVTIATGEADRIVDALMMVTLPASEG